jgi:hypothetical protein
LKKWNTYKQEIGRLSSETYKNIRTIAILLLICQIGLLVAMVRYEAPTSDWVDVSRDRAYVYEEVVYVSRTWYYDSSTIQINLFQCNDSVKGSEMWVVYEPDINLTIGTKVQYSWILDRETLEWMFYKWKML